MSPDGHGGTADQAVQAAPASATRRYCIVIAMFNEALNIPPLLDRLEAVFADLPGRARIVLVDDGSTDDSVEVATREAQRRGNVDIVQLSRNFGHHTALLAGLDHAEGDVFALMDADLQDRPEDLPRMIEAFDAGHDLVYAIRTQRTEPWLRRLGSSLFWWLVNVSSESHCPPHQAVLRLFGANVRDAVVQLRERHNFLAGMFAWVGFSSTCIEVEQAPRLYGQPKYSIAKMLKQAINAITSFSMKPMRLMVYGGVVVAVFALVFGSYLLFDRLLGGAFLPGWSSIMVALFFSLGMQMIGLGMVGEYVGRIFEQTKERPEYIVREIRKAEE